MDDKRKGREQVQSDEKPRKAQSGLLFLASGRLSKWLRRGSPQVSANNGPRACVKNQRDDEEETKKRVSEKTTSMCVRGI